MKKLMVIIGLTVIMMLTAPLAVLASSYQWSISIANSTSTAYSNVPFTAPISTAAWISSHYIQSNGLDVKVMDGTTALPTEVTDTGLWWVGKIGKKTTKTITLSTGNTPATSMPIIVGGGGEITTSYNAGLELTGKWQINILAYINTADIGGYVLNKSGEITIQVTAIGTLTTTIYDGSPETIIFTGIDSGYYPLSLTKNGALTLIVGSNSGTAAVGTVTNNTNDWIWDSDGLVMPYITSISIKQ